MRQTPDKEAHALWQADRLQMRQEKNSDLIVSATGAGEGRGKVVTADGREHLVAGDSYDCTRTPCLLSKCVLA